MAIEIVSFPINSMVIFHSYVKLPEAMFISVLGEQMCQGIYLLQMEQVNYEFYGHLIKKKVLVNYGYYD